MRCWQQYQFVIALMKMFSKQPLDVYTKLKQNSDNTLFVQFNDLVICQDLFKIMEPEDEKRAMPEEYQIWEQVNESTENYSIMYQEETDNTHAAYLKETEKEKQIMETGYQIN